MSLKNNLKIKVSLITFIIGSLFIILYTVIDHSIFKRQISQITINNELKKIYERENYFLDTLSFAKDTIMAIRTNKLFEQYINSPDNAKENLTYLFENTIKSDKQIMQIRFIDRNGLEQIRIDRDKDNKNNILHIQHHQDKSSRDYFQNNKNSLESVVFSNLDLNIENGKIEIPFNPTYRVILPIKNQDNFTGMIIINYFAEEFLLKLFNAPLYDSILIDSDGYILYHYKNEKRWSKFIEKPFKIENKYMQILDTNTDFYQNDNFILKKLNLPLANQLYMILTINEKNKQAEHAIYKQRAVVVLSVFIFLMFLLSIVLYFILQRIEKREEEILELNKLKKEQETILKQKSKMASMGDMIADIAHQWRQPLSILSLNTTNLELKLKRDKADKEFLENYIVKVNKTIKNMDQTIKDFSEFFKPNKPKVEFELNSLIEEAQYLLKDLFIKKQIIINFEPKNEYNYSGYKNELLQVILNILNNSKDAIVNNAIKNGIVSIKIKDDDDIYIIYIQDNGGGIPPEIENRIFEPYYTTKFKNQGTGIGLYMCKTIIEESLKGSLSLKNYKDGTQCIITLPKV